MLPEENEKPHRLDDIQKRLYSPNPKAIPKPRQGILHQVSHSVSNVWNDQKTEKVVTVVKDVSMKSSLFKKFFIAAVIFFIIALCIGGIFFLTGSSSVSSDNIQINVLGNAYTPGGDELPLTIEIANSNAVDLELVDLVTEYGRNKADLSDPSDVATIRQSIGTIPSGKTVNQKVDLTLYGTEGTSKQVKFTLEYHVAGSNAIFQKDKDFAVTINTAPVTLAVDADTSTTAGQPYTLTVNLTSNVKKVLPNMLLKIDYPNGFSFKNSEPGPSYMSNIWNLGDLNPGDSKQIKIVGVISAQDGEERSFRVYTGSASTADKNVIGTTFTSILHTVDIVKPFLQANLAINGQQASEIIAQPKSTVSGTINWANNLPVSILNATISVKLNGDLIDTSTVQSNGGFYNSSNNTITWDRNTLDVLANVAPGASGTLGFTFATKSLYQNGTLSSNPQVTLDVSISGQQPQQGVANQEVNSIEHTIIKLTTDFQVTGQASYSGEPFLNTGPLPPVAGGKTTYTIKWILTSSANDVSGVQVKAALPSYVHFLNLVNPTTSDLKIDPVSGNLVWNAGTVPKGAGFTGNSKSVSFQIELDPSSSQIGSSPVLVNTISATGTDTYTNTPLNSSWKQINTQLFNDPAYNPNDDKVVAQ